jgi:hypothetical protein
MAEDFGAKPASPQVGCREGLGRAGIVVLFREWCREGRRRWSRSRSGWAAGDRRARPNEARVPSPARERGPGAAGETGLAILPDRGNRVGYGAGKR